MRRRSTARSQRTIIEHQEQIEAVRLLWSALQVGAQYRRCSDCVEIAAALDSSRNCTALAVATASDDDELKVLVRGQKGVSPARHGFVPKDLSGVQVLEIHAAVPRR